jgi:hypothetical protein
MLPARVIASIPARPKRKDEDLRLETKDTTGAKERRAPVMRERAIFP